MGSRPALHRSDYKQFCELLRRWREEAGLTQRELAKRLGIDHTQIHRNEVGSRRIDPLELLRLLRALDVDPAKALLRIEDLLGPQRRRKP